MPYEKKQIDSLLCLLPAYCLLSYTFSLTNYAARGAMPIICLHYNLFIYHNNYVYIIIYLIFSVIFIITVSKLFIK